jgi:hypothetical protein
MAERFKFLVVALIGIRDAQADTPHTGGPAGGYDAHASKAISLYVADVDK